MPKNQFQRMIFALITVIITVHAYVFYSLYVVNGNTLMEINGTNSVLKAIAAQGGVYMCGNYVPIWAVVITEFLLAYLLENIMGSPFSFRLSSKVFDPEKTHPVIFETAIICTTVGLMCPVMAYVPGYEPDCRIPVLSILWRLSYSDIAGKLVEISLPEFSVALHQLYVNWQLQTGLSVTVFYKLAVGLL